MYEEFGFPIKLSNVPMKKVVGEWVIDVNFDSLEKGVLRLLIHKSTPLTGPEFRFIRKWLGLTTIEFGKIFGVSHPAVLKWENGRARPPIAGDIYLRLYILTHLKAKDREFRTVLEESTAERLIERRNKRVPSLSIDVEKDLRSA